MKYIKIWSKSSYWNWKKKKGRINSL